MRLPLSLKQRLDEEVEDANQSANAFAMRYIEQCLRLRREDVLGHLASGGASASSDLATLETTPEAFTEEGVLEIALHASNHLKDAIRALGFSDRELAAAAERRSGDAQNWSGREHNNLRAAGWKVP